MYIISWEWVWNLQQRGEVNPKGCIPRRVPEGFAIKTFSSTSISAWDLWEIESLPYRIWCSRWSRDTSVSEWLFRTCKNETYRLIGSLPENSKQEDSCNGWSQVTGNRLDVIEELPTLCWLHNGYPGNADTYQHQDEQPEIKIPQYNVNKWLYMNKYILLCVRCMIYICIICIWLLYVRCVYIYIIYSKYIYT